MPCPARRSRLLIQLTVLSILVACAPEPPPRHSVLLVSADSLRVDRLRLFNPGDGVPTPELEGLARRGTVFTRAWATSPWTAPSMVSVFTGLQPPSHGVFARDDTTPRGLATLPRLLEERGYRLGNFSFFSGISYFRNLGLPEPQKGLSHPRVTESFRRWLGAGDPQQPFFAWLHLLEPHLPYGATGYRATGVQMPGSTGLEQAQLRAAVPVGSAELTAGDREKLVALYDRDLTEMDRALGRVLAALGEQGREAETLIVFVADHGEELLEHGWIGHASTAVEAKLVPEILRVPLVLAGPGVPAGEVCDELVQPVDVLPTLGRLLDLPLPETLDGRVLPGLESPWWPFRRRRGYAFFDSSMGGNLTPVERRAERLQGATDGRCLLTSHLTPGRPEAVEVVPVAPEAVCDVASREELAQALAEWRRRQGAQRLAILAQSPGASPPSAEEAERFAETITVISPAPGQALSWNETRGQVSLGWEGEGSSWWIEYRAGSGLIGIEGSFQVERPGIVFGPFPQGFWNDLATYSPMRFRVLDAEGRRRSGWVTFEIVPVG